MRQPLRTKILVILAALAVLLPAAQANAQSCGSIYVSTRTLSWGWSNNYRTVGDAQNRAYNECGGDCEMATWFCNACGALATRRDRGGATAWGASSGYSIRDAEIKALQWCESMGHGPCSVAVSLCTGG
jgi:hypothetical protein